MQSVSDCQGFVFMRSQSKCWRRAHLRLPRCENGRYGLESYEDDTYVKIQKPPAAPTPPLVAYSSDKNWFSNGAWTGVLRWFGGSASCPSDLVLDKGSHTLKVWNCPSEVDQSRWQGHRFVKEWWGDENCGTISEFWNWGAWPVYWGGVTVYEPGAVVEAGHVWAITHPSTKVPCGVGLNVSLVPFPTKFSPGNLSDDGSCQGPASEPFQIQSGNKCVTVSASVVAGPGLKAVEVQPCRQGDVKQLFTYHYQGCD